MQNTLFNAFVFILIVRSSIAVCLLDWSSLICDAKKWFRCEAVAAMALATQTKQNEKRNARIRFVLCRSLIKLATTTTTTAGKQKKKDEVAINTISICVLTRIKTEHEKKTRFYFDFRIETIDWMLANFDAKWSTNSNENKNEENEMPPHEPYNLHWTI